jgi:hypothetical protein
MISSPKHEVTPFGEPFCQIIEFVEAESLSCLEALQDLPMIKRLMMM